VAGGYSWRWEEPGEEAGERAEALDHAAAEAAPEIDGGGVLGGVDEEIGGVGVGADDEVVLAVAVREPADGEELEVEGAVAEGGLQAIGELVEGKEVDGVGSEEGVQGGERFFRGGSVGDGVRWKGEGHGRGARARRFVVLRLSST
jgi:hypothetical protein